MKQFLKSKKGITLLATLLVAIVAAVGAYAYFTSAGSGSGSATVGSAGATDIALDGSTADAVYPDGPAADVDIAITNNGDGSEYVDTVSLGAVTDADLTCDTSVFTMPDVAVGETIAAGATFHATGHLSMADNGLDQNSCQGDALSFELSSN